MTRPHIRRARTRDYVSGLALLLPMFMLAASCGEQDGGSSGARAKNRVLQRVLVRLGSGGEQGAGAPASARIRLIPEVESAGTVDVFLESSGAYEAKLVEHVRYRVSISEIHVVADDGGTTRLSPDRFEARPDRVELTHESRSVPSEVVIQLVRRAGPCELEVALETPGEGESRAVVETRINGEFVQVAEVTLREGPARVTGLWPGTYRVSLTAPGEGQADFRMLEGGFGYASVRATVQVAAGQITRAVLVPPEAGAVRVVIDRTRLPRRLLGGFLSFHRQFEGCWAPLPHAPELSTSRESMEDGGRRVLTLSYGNVPVGTYRLLLRRTGFVVQARRLEVEPGAEVQCEFGAFKAGLSVTLVWPGAIPTTEDYGTSIPFGLNRLDYETAQDVDLGVFKPGRKSVTLNGPRSGRYLAIFNALGVARVVDLKPGSAARVVLEPPDNFINGGERRVHVTVHRAGKRLTRLMLGLVPAGTGPLLDGQWLRFRSLGRSATFTKVPPGSYELLVFDAAFGARYGLARNPVRHPVRVSNSDLTVDVDV